MSDQNKSRRSPRVWSASEINAQLDELAEAIVQGSHEFVKGFLFGVPSRRRGKQKPPAEKKERQP